MEDSEEKHLKRKIKILLLMADNEGDKKENHKFLFEFQCFREEHTDIEIPSVLREAVWNAEYELKMEELSVFKKDSAMEWSETTAVVVRDNDDRRVREMFCERDRYWRPLFGYKERDKLAMEYCKCNECTFITKKRILREEGLGDITREEFSRSIAGKKQQECTKSDYFLPYAERDDDLGVYPPDEHYIQVTVPALEEGMKAMEEERKFG